MLKELVESHTIAARSGREARGSIMTTATITAGRAMHDVEGVQVSILRGGSGTPLLFLHGSDAFGDCSRSWKRSRSSMTSSCRPSGLRPLRYAGVARHDRRSSHFYRSLIETLGLHDVVLAGHGLGGWIACELALRNPMTCAPSCSSTAPVCR